MHISFLSTWRYTHTMAWALLLSLLIVGIAATIGRATIKLRGALTDEDGTLAVMMLSKKKISSIEMVKAGMDPLKDDVQMQEFLTETEDGPELVRASRVDGKWEITQEINLHE